MPSLEYLWMRSTGNGISLCLSCSPQILGVGMTQAYWRWAYSNVTGKLIWEPCIFSTQAGANQYQKIHDLYIL